MADEFNTALEAHIQGLITTWVGVGSDPTYYVRSFDDHLRPFESTESPLIVVAARQGRPATNSDSIGATPNDKTWDIEIYFLSLGADYTTEKRQRDFIVNRLWNMFEIHSMLGSFTHVEDSGVTNQVIGSNVESVTFDTSGEDGYYTFVTEMHLTVDVTSGI